MTKKILSSVMALVLVLLVFCSCGKSETLRLGSGNEGGTYYKYSQTLSGFMNENVDIKSTAGSEANLRLIKEGFLDMAIVQSDLLNNETENGAGYSAVAGLYTESCQIVVKADSPIKTVADLYGKKVSVGEKESGSLRNAEQILDVAGMKISDIKASYLSFKDSSKALKDGEIDAFFCTALVMMPVMEELSSSTSIRLISLDSSMIERLIKNHNGYTKSEIPANTYSGQTESVTTVGVKAVLIANNELADNKVADVLKTIFDKSIDLKNECKLSTDLSPEFATEGISIPFHTGVKDFFAEKNITVNTNNKNSGTGIKAGQDN